jgi:hypothetical protein
MRANGCNGIIDARCVSIDAFNCECHRMAKEFKIPSIKKVVTVLSILWPIGCLCMLLSMHYFTRSLIVFFSTLAAVPIVVSWVLVFVSRYLDKRTEPQWMRNRGKAAGKAQGGAGAKGGGRPQGGAGAKGGGRPQGGAGAQGGGRAQGGVGAKAGGGAKKEGV